MRTYIKDKADFLNNYEDFAMLVFYKEIGEKVEIKIAIPAYEKEVKLKLKNIKD